MKQPLADSYFIQHSLSLAKKAEGFVSPNPLVGALIVKRGRIIAKGYHRKCGLPHAEIEAIKKAGRGNCRGTTLYINLEPCFHFGRTPPCVDTIIQNKFKRVVIATIDPNPKVYGRSIKKLRRAGIKVDVGILEKEARKLNEVFFTNMKLKRPFIVAKLAQSLDGKIATRKGISQWITTQSSRRFSKSLRDKYDAVLVGINTVVNDNPTLEGLKKVPFRVIIDPQLRIPLKAYILKQHSQKTVIITTSKKRSKLKLIPSSVKILFLRKESDGIIPVRKILKSVYSLGIRSIFVEGGSETIGRFFDQRLIDKVLFFIAPKIIGGRQALTSVGACGFSNLKSAPYLKDIEIKRLAEDIFISGYPQYKRVASSK